jgi:hypothetical protein
MADAMRGATQVSAAATDREGGGGHPAAVQGVKRQQEEEMRRLSQYVEDVAVTSFQTAMNCLVASGQQGWCAHVCVLMYV